jgi:predicted lipid-binding transport protein (Tim44 family)
MAASQPVPEPPQADPPARVVNASLSVPAKAPASDTADMQFVGLLVVAGVLVTLLLAGGIGFTIRECMRLFAESKHRQLAASGVRVGAANDANSQANNRVVA